MRSAIPSGMLLPGVGTGMGVRASIGRVDDAETGSRVRPGGAASSKPSRWHVGVRRVGQHASPVRENCGGLLTGAAGFLENCA